MNPQENATLAEAPNSGASAVLDPAEVMPGDDPMDFVAGDWDAPVPTDGAEDEEEASEENPDQAEEEAEAKPEEGAFVMIGEDKVPVAHVEELWADIKEAMQDEVAAELLKQNTVKELALKAAGIDSQKVQTYDAMVARLESSPKGAKEVIGHLLGYAMRLHPQDLEGFDAIDLSAITNPEDLSPSEQGLYMAARAQADIASRLAEQSAKLAEELAEAKKTLGERDIEPKLAEAVAKALPGQAPTGPEVRAAMQKHGVQNPVSAWRLELLERGDAEAAGGKREGGAPASVPKKSAGVKEFDPAGKTADQVYQLMQAGYVPRKRN